VRTEIARTLSDACRDWRAQASVATPLTNTIGMPASFSRHEQFLRIFALLEILSAARQPLDDQALIAALKERLGLARLSTRTLHRDCAFLLSCGYPVDHSPLPGDRKYGWQLSKIAASGKRIPAEPLTLLELVAFSMGRDLLRSFEGTVLWTGIESLRHKIERDLPPAMLEQLKDAKKVFHVEGGDPAKYAGRPRLISLLSNAITDCREIEIEERVEGSSTPQRHRLQPQRLVIRPPVVKLLGFPAGATDDVKPMLLDIERIEKVTPLDVTFVPRPIDPDLVSDA
jgi:predicted DNA-binding transcriptional regulator YafY